MKPIFGQNFLFPVPFQKLLDLRWWLVWRKCFEKRGRKSGQLKRRMAVPFSLLLLISFLSHIYIFLLMFSFLVWKSNCFVFLQIVKRSAGDCWTPRLWKDNWERERERERERESESSQTTLPDILEKSSILNYDK